MLVETEMIARKTKEKWQNKVLDRKSKNEYMDSEKASIKCKCPKCDSIHQAHMHWTGRGMPRIYCSACKSRVSGVSDMALECEFAGSMQRSHKKAAHCCD